ncbi:ATP-binding cassette domain-containing protein [Gordonia sp. SID5947]|nr:ATP-binding cassette domain-containing protein [Gordonia sp. SID5947]MYR07204.1 ATP-binding cassette domain-containing protein [Gordonia sp. SID5947]
MERALQVDIANTLPPLHIEHTFAFGSTTAVVGPNGAGKTTLLRVVAGLIRGGESRVTLDGDLLAGGHTFVPAHRRGVALLSQEARLFPHLTVRGNVAFAPAAQRLGRSEVAARVQRWLEAVEVADLADRRPAELSGGQAQRVAIARALAAQPRILLLDEPFRALDVEVAGRLRALLRDLLLDRTRTTIMVTHDVVDVVTLADSAMVVDDGRIVDSGPVGRVLASPANAFAARLAGLNLVSGLWDGSTVVSGAVAVAGTVAEPVHTGGHVTAVFAPDAVAVFRAPPSDASFRNVFEISVGQVVPHGDRMLVRGTVDGHVLAAEITAAAVTELSLVVGAQVCFAVKASAVRIY